MKKLFLVLFAAAASLALQSSVFASGGTGIVISTGHTTKVGGANFLPSTNVTVCAKAVSDEYCSSSLHKSSSGPSAAGGREWATYSAASTGIYVKDATVLAPQAECEQCSDSGTLPGGNNFTTWKPQ